MTHDHAGRRHRLRSQLAHLGADGLVVTQLANIRYLTGFSGSNAVLFVSAKDPDDDVLGTDARYGTQVAEQAPDLPVILDRSTVAAVARSLAAHGVTHVCVESSITLHQLESMRAEIRTCTPTDDLVAHLRVTKDAAEIEALTQACRISVAAFETVMSEVRPGWSEVRVARRLEQVLGELGAEDRAFPTIVGAGPRSAVPHHEPTSAELHRGDLVVVDFGARVDGYHADMTRTAVVGEPATWQVELHEAVLQAQTAARAALSADADLRAIDRVARGLLEQAGLGEAFGHGLGHGVGLEIHEAPMLGPRSTGTLPLNTSITVEPGAYLPGRGGVRIEDTLVVGPQGPRVLTEADRSLWLIGA